MRFCADCKEPLAPTSPAAAVYCGPCGRTLRYAGHERKKKCVCCAGPVKTTGRTCSPCCAETMMDFANALRETLGLAPLYRISTRKEEPIAAE